MTIKSTKIKTIDTPKVQPKQHKQKSSYAEVLSQTTKTVAQLWDTYHNYFPVEYGVLINPERLPAGNGNILRFSKDPIEDYVMIFRPKDNKRGYFNDEELEDLSNCRVFLEPNQTELNYINRWFKYSMEEREITDYRLRQMYWMSKLDSESEDDNVNDPDYIPDEDEEVDDVDEYTSEDEDEEDIESDEDEDDSEDYTPSVESEEEDSDEYSSEEDDSEEEDKSPDYTPSVESEEEESDDDYEDVAEKYKLLKQQLKQQHQKQASRKSQKTRAH
jgi:hypothetical protein